MFPICGALNCVCDSNTNVNNISEYPMLSHWITGMQNDEQCSHGNISRSVDHTMTNTNTLHVMKRSLMVNTLFTSFIRMTHDMMVLEIGLE